MSSTRNPNPQAEARAVGGNADTTHLIYGDGSEQELACGDGPGQGSTALLAGALAACAWRSVHDLLVRLEVDHSALQVEILRKGDTFRIRTHGVPQDPAIRRRCENAVRRCPVANALRVAPISEFA